MDACKAIRQIIPISHILYILLKKEIHVSYRSDPLY